MTQDKNKGIGTGNIHYNFLNLPRSVRKSGADSLVYTYDATGRKLRQRLYGDTTKVTDYINEYVYEDNVLQFLNHAEGRVLMTGTPEYQYHMKDHLGNVRMTFTTTAEVDEATATLEAANLTAEQAKFLRIENARRIYSIHFDRTNGASAGYAQRLNGSTNEKFGMARSLSVMPGDTIRAEVYGKYVDTNTGNWTGAMTTLMGQIAAGAGGVVFEGGSYGSSTSSFSLGGLLNTTGSTGGPKAYLNWLIFDKNYNLVDGGYKRMSTAPKEYGQDVAHERLFLSKSGHEYIVVDQPGYVYIYLSNEEATPVEVYFDDLSVEHAMGPLVQMDDYYPFGLTFNSHRRETAVKNRSKFQSQEHVDDLALNWEYFRWRNHQPDIGRFFNVDPLSSDFPQWSPYVFSGNMVTVSKELEGLEPDFMIHGNNGIPGSANRITAQMSTLLSAAFGFSPESIGQTRWFRDDDPRAHWFATKVVPDQALAITWGRTVVYDHLLSGASHRYWFTLIAHEQRHRDDVHDYGDLLFYGSYVLEGARVGGAHDDLQHEEVANIDESYAGQLWDYNGGEVQRIFNMNCSGREASDLLKSVGSRFRRDVILSDKIAGARSSISKINRVMRGVSDKGIRNSLQGLIGAYNKQINEAENEQQDITDQYGN